jgi:hypothetical protein
VSAPDGPLLDRATITEALRRLGERLAYRGVVADVYVLGGAAMALAYDLRRTTRDIDALFRPHGVVLAEAQSVALELGLPRWWLNEQASAYVAPGGDPQAALVAAPAIDETHAARAHAPGRQRAGCSGSATAEAPPARDQHDEHGREEACADRNAGMRRQIRCAALVERGRCHHALGEGDHDGHAFARRERPRGAERGRAFAHEAVVIVAARALGAGPGVELHALGRHRMLEAHFDA